MRGVNCTGGMKLDLTIAVHLEIPTPRSVPHSRTLTFDLKIAANVRHLKQEVVLLNCRVDVIILPRSSLQGYPSLATSGLFRGPHSFSEVGRCSRG